ncbi:hypothetical protein JB92DRAFT_385060 [Gautieria morchelliformis]|nr:hypothetical protein JB92DRAFT_385060 [Gautieria morchelliformis]
MITAGSGQWIMNDTEPELCSTRNIRHTAPKAQGLNCLTQLGTSRCHLPCTVVRDSLLQKRAELFMQRIPCPVMLVLIHDSDWELER